MRKNAKGSMDFAEALANSLHPSLVPCGRMLKVAVCWRVPRNMG